MEDITNIDCCRLIESPYIKSLQFVYTQNGVQKSRDILKFYDSVSIVLFNTCRNVLLFVNQFRPAVYHAQVFSDGINKELDTVKFPPQLGVTIELCSGLIDTNMSMEEVVRKRIQEDIGYTVSSDRIENVISYRTSEGRGGAKQTMFYCEVNDSEKCELDDSEVDKLLDVVEYSIDDAKNLIQSATYINGPPTLLFGLFWFLNNKAAMFIKE